LTVVAPKPLDDPVTTAIGLESFMAIFSRIMILHTTYHEIKPGINKLFQVAFICCSDNFSFTHHICHGQLQRQLSARRLGRGEVSNEFDFFIGGAWCFR